MTHPGFPSMPSLPAVPPLFAPTHVTPLRRLTVALVAALVLAIAPAPVQGQPVLEDDPGYVDLSRVASWFDAEPSVEIDVTGSLLTMVSNASEASNPRFARLLREMKAIQVRSYPLDAVDGPTLTRRMDALVRDLERDGWTRALVVREAKESVRMFVRHSDDNRIAGLTVLSVDPSDGESVFVNIVGPFPPDDLERLGDVLDVKAMGSAKTEG